MKKQKGSLLQRMTAVLLAAVLVTGMVWDAAPVSALAQESVSENTPEPGMEEEKEQETVSENDADEETAVTDTDNVAQGLVTDGDDVILYDVLPMTEERTIQADAGYTELTYAAAELGAYGRWNNTPVALTDGKLIIKFAEQYNEYCLDLPKALDMADCESITVRTADQSGSLCFKIYDSAKTELKAYYGNSGQNEYTFIPNFSGSATCIGVEADGSDIYPFTAQMVSIIFRMKKVSGDETHTHKICAGSSCADGSHEDVEWIPLTFTEGKMYAGEKEITKTSSGYKLKDGNYYLADNIRIDDGLSQICIDQADVHLCLNGKTLSFGESNVWIYGGKLTLCDCAGNGAINAAKKAAVGISNISSGKRAFIMYGGSLQGSGCDFVAGAYSVESEAKFFGGNVADMKVKLFREYGTLVLTTPIFIGQPVKTGTKIKVDFDWWEEGDGKLSDVPVVKAAEGYTFTEADLANLNIEVIATGYTDTAFQKKMQNGTIVLCQHKHVLTKHETVPATCEKQGTGEYWKCEGTDGCGKMFSDAAGTSETTPDSVKIAALGHDYNTSEWGYKGADGHAHNCRRTGCGQHDTVVAHTPGAAATESTPQTCTECGYIMNPAIGHTCDPRLVEKKEPNCTTAGKAAYYHCEGCGKNYEDAEGKNVIADINAWGNIAALGHDWGEWKVTKPATATKPGEKERTCKRCDEKETEIIPKTGGGDKPGGGGQNDDGHGDDDGNQGGGDNGGAGDSAGGGLDGGNNNGNGGGNGSSGGGSNGGSGGNSGGSSAGNTAGNTGGAGAGASGKPGTGQPKVKQEKEGNIQKEVRVEGEDTLDAAVETPLSELADMVLTKEEKQKAADGTDIRIVLEVKDGSAVVSAADRTLVEKALNGPKAKGYTLGEYLDISLYKVIGNSRNIITETNGKVTLRIDVPDSLKNTDAAKTRTFAVIRVHNGKTELLSDLDNNEDTITIATDRFSTYAVVYKDTAGKNSIVRISVEDGGKKSGGAKDDEPKTGDNAPLELCATLSMIAGFAYLLVYFTDRERGMTEETKKELVTRLVAWAKRVGRCRIYLALAAIFVLLVYYHSIGKKTCVRWKAIC